MFSFVVIVAYVSSTIILSLVVLYFHCKFMIGMCTNTNSLQGKTVLITGGNSGIGFEAAKEFARRGARLLLPCRDQVKARAAIANIIKDTGNRDITLFRLDISSLQSVEDFVKVLTSSGDIKINILCLNAGCLSSARPLESVDGFEYIFATNLLGHFHLTNLVQPLLASSARIIITSSIIYETMLFKPSFFQPPKNSIRMFSYTLSKLMNVYHMRELATRLNNCGITVNAIHPGFVNTSIFKGHSLVDWMSSRLACIYGRTPWEGAQTMIHVATCEKLQGVTGQYFMDCKPRALARVGRDEEAPRELWEYCEQLITEWREKKQH